MLKKVYSPGPRLDHIRNEDIRKEAHIKLVETFLENKRLKVYVEHLRKSKSKSTFI